MISNINLVVQIYLNQGEQPMPIMTLQYEKDAKTVNELQHSFVSLVAKDINFIYIPYKNLSMSMLWFNDTQRGYSKILRFESMIADNLPGPFLDLRQATKFNSGGTRGNYNWNATVTSSSFQGRSFFIFCKFFHLLFLLAL